MKTFTKALVITSFLFSISACTAFTDITSSTSSTLDAVTPDVTLNEFVNKRYVAIRHDAANGGGENIDALAQLMGKEDTRAFAKLMKLNFDSIFTNVEQPAEILARIEASSLTNNG